MSAGETYLKARAEEHAERLQAQLSPAALQSWLADRERECLFEDRKYYTALRAAISRATGEAK